MIRNWFEGFKRTPLWMKRMIVLLAVVLGGYGVYSLFYPKIPPPEVSLEVEAARLDFAIQAEDVEHLLRSFDTTKLTFSRANHIDLGRGRMELASTGKKVPSDGRLEAADQFSVSGTGLDGATMSQSEARVSLFFAERGSSILHLTIEGVEAVHLQPAQRLTLTCDSSCNGEFGQGEVHFESSGPLGHRASIHPADHTLRLAAEQDSFEIESLPIRSLHFQKSLDAHVGRLASTIESGELYFEDLGEKDGIRIRPGQVLQMDLLPGFSLNSVVYSRDSHEKISGLKVIATGGVKAVTIHERNVVPNVFRRLIGIDAAVFWSNVGVVVVSVGVILVTMKAIHHEEGKSRQKAEAADGSWEFD
jgi:hypothetical protein